MTTVIVIGAAIGALMLIREIWEQWQWSRERRHCDLRIELFCNALPHYQQLGLSDAEAWRRAQVWVHRAANEQLGYRRPDWRTHDPSYAVDRETVV